MTNQFQTFISVLRTLWNFNPDNRYYDRVAGLWKFANELNPIQYPRGIYKFKNIVDANKHRMEIEIAHARRIHTERERNSNGETISV